MVNHGIRVGEMNANQTEYSAIIEGLLFARGEEGVTLNQVVKRRDIHHTTVTELIGELMSDYERADRGIMVIKSHEVYHLTTKPEHSSYYKKLLQSPQSSRMSQAAL